MKKLTAIILSILCLFSVFALPASAGTIADDISDLFDSSEEEKPLIYYLSYKKETLSEVKVMYFPNPGLSFDGPGYVTVTNDTPISINHDFVCWKDKEGNLYYAGDKYYVDGECSLYAVWEEKKDNDSYVLRVIKCAIATFLRMFQKALGIFETIDEFNKDYYATMTDASSETTAAPAEETTSDVAQI